MGRRVRDYIYPSYVYIKECSGCSGRLMKYQLWLNLHCSWVNFTSLPLNVNFYNHWSTAFLELAWEGQLCNCSNQIVCRNNNLSFTVCLSTNDFNNGTTYTKRQTTTVRIHSHFSWWCVQCVYIWHHVCICFGLSIGRCHRGPPSNKMVKPRYISTSDSLSQVNSVVVNAVSPLPPQNRL